MKVSSHSAALAILHVFDENRVRDGGRLMVSDIAEAWKDSGMRRSDIVEGIRLGMALGGFALEQETDGPSLTLLNRALIESGGARDLTGKWDAALAQAVRQKAARRKPALAPPTERRRKS